MSAHSDACQVCTYAPDGAVGTKIWMGSLGHVGSLNFGSVLPGGDAVMSCLLQRPASDRPAALNPGRKVQVVRGALEVWTGRLAEPAPSPDGWTVIATGRGVTGGDFAAWYPVRNDNSGITVTYNSTTVLDPFAVSADLNLSIAGSGIQDGTVITATVPGSGYTISLPASASAHTGTWLTVYDQSLNSPVDAAISRGLDWKNPGIAAGFLPSIPLDPASSSITDHMNSVTSKNGQTWSVDRFGTLATGPLPYVVTNLLVTTDPVPRTLFGDCTTLWVKYVLFDDLQGNVVYDTTSYVNAAAAGVHGTFEAYLDLSPAGQITTEYAQDLAQMVMQKYTRAAFVSPFSIRYGQLRNLGGSPVDLPTARAGMVCQLYCMDAPQGGEVTAGKIRFPVGAYSYDDDSCLATITPVQSFSTSLGTVLSNYTSWG
jgi:hypothetical protein